MLLEIAIILSIAWLAVVLGLYRAGDLVHALLLGALFLVLLAVVRARDEAARRRRT